MRGNHNPIIDHDLFTELNSVALNKGAFVPVPLLIGTNTNEGTPFLPLFVNISANYTSGLRLAIVRWGGETDLLTRVIDELSELYSSMDDTAVASQLSAVLTGPGSRLGSFYDWVSLLLGDWVMIGGRRISAQAWASHGVDTYSNRFDSVPASMNPQTLGAAHYQEVSCVFNITHGVGYELNLFDISSPGPNTVFKIQKISYLMHQRGIVSRGTISESNK